MKEKQKTGVLNSLNFNKMKINRFSFIRLYFAMATLFVSSGIGYAQNSKFISSPVYHVDIGLNYTGQCSPYEDGATFSQYSAIGTFNSLRFVGSLSTEYPCWIQPKDNVAFIMTNGEGNIVTYQICPDFDPEPRKARVTYGPVPFKPCLAVLSKEELEGYLEESDFVPENPPLAPVVWFRYSDCFSIANPELRWETEIGGGVAESRMVFFYVTLINLGKGEPIHLTVPYHNGLEVGTWDITFTTE
jgi:hypothetical protein